MENLLIYLFSSILLGLLVLTGFIIYISLNVELVGVPTFKNPPPVPCKPIHQSHDWILKGFDIDYEYYTCKNCGIEKQIKNY